MKKAFISLLFILFFTNLDLIAQPKVGEGCATGPGTSPGFVYQIFVDQSGSTRRFRRGGSYTTWAGVDQNAYSCFRWIPSSSYLCQYRLEPSLFYTTGYYGYFTDGNVPCPIDDYVPYIIVVFGGLGFIYFKKTTFSS